jgi:hypothetical protein
MEMFRMSKRTIDHSGKDTFRKPRLTADQKTLIEYRERWRVATGYLMPLSIQLLSLEVILRAVEMAEKKTLPVVVGSRVVVTRDENESMMEWDNED